jgi:3-carboxy-cis,cis-muconate cycloisomerase
MRENLDATGGMLLAENVTTLAAERLGRLKAHDLVQAACHRALDRGGHLREELLEDPEICEVLSPEEIDAALDPAGYPRVGRTRSSGGPWTFTARRIVSGLGKAQSL